MENEAAFNAQAIVALFKILSLIIGGAIFIIALAMLKNFFGMGVSVAISEFLIRNSDQEMRERIVRWFGNGDKILQYLSYIDEKMNREKKVNLSR